MVLYENKRAFLQHGVETIIPSQYNIFHDCPICKDPLQMVPRKHDNNHVPSSFHIAVRIKACRHVHGQECLLAWLSTGHTCPTCNQILFIPPSEQVITQADVNALLHTLGFEYGEDIVMRAIAREMKQVEDAAVKRRQQYETQVERGRLEEEARAKKEREEFMLKGDDFVDSDGDGGDTDWENGGDDNFDFGDD